jgi:hypothetical protein
MKWLRSFVPSPKSSVQCLIEKSRAINRLMRIGRAYSSNILISELRGPWIFWTNYPSLMRWTEVQVPKAVITTLKPNPKGNRILDSLSVLVQQTVNTFYPFEHAYQDEYYSAASVQHFKTPHVYRGISLPYTSLCWSSSTDCHFMRTLQHHSEISVKLLKELFVLEEQLMKTCTQYSINLRIL